MYKSVDRMILATAPGAKPSPSVKGYSFVMPVGGENVRFFLHENIIGEMILSHWTSGRSILKADGMTMAEHSAKLKSQGLPSTAEATARHMILCQAQTMGEARLRSAMASAGVLNQSTTKG